MNCQICKVDKYSSLTFTDCICCFGKNKIKTTKCHNTSCQFYYHEQCAYNYILGGKTNKIQNPYACPMKCGYNISVSVPYSSFTELNQENKDKKKRNYTLNKHWLTIIFYLIVCIIFDVYYVSKYYAV